MDAKQQHERELQSQVNDAYAQAYNAVAANPDAFSGVFGG
jgi:hypothetical protein